MPLKATDIEALAELFARSGWSEMHLELDGEEVFLSTDSRARPGAAAIAPAQIPAQIPAEIPAQIPAQIPASAAAAPAAPAAGRTPARPDHWVAIAAPNLGTFYRAPSPDAAAYTQVGATVAADSEICLIEVMKLFTTVRAGIAGTVREIAAEDGQMVEYGQTLFWIEPA